MSSLDDFEAAHVNYWEEPDFKPCNVEAVGEQLITSSGLGIVSGGSGVPYAERMVTDANGTVLGNLSEVSIKAKALRWFEPDFEYEDPALLSVGYGVLWDDLPKKMEAIDARGGMEFPKTDIDRMSWAITNFDELVSLVGEDATAEYVAAGFDLVTVRAIAEHGIDSSLMVSVIRG